jgi:hypothetical protein
MDVEDLATSEVVIAVVATAAVLSSRARRVARRGLVYGVAGALSAGAMLTSFSKGVAGGVLDTAQSMQQHVEGQSNQDESDTAKGEPA